MIKINEKHIVFIIIFQHVTLFASDTFKLSVSLTNLVKLEQVYGGSGHVYFLKDELTHKKYVFKANANILQMKEEIVANALYQALEVNVPNFTVLNRIPACLSQESLPHSSLYLLTEFIEGKQMGKLHGQAYVEAKDRVAQDFVTDAFLSNWDIIKTGAFDLKPSKNIIVSNTGKPVRVDNGGSLRFRAKGGLKKFVRSWDPTRVVELEAMRNPRLNPDGARIFGVLSNNNILEQIHAILQKENTLKNALDDVALAIELDRKDYEELKQILSERLKNLALIASPESSSKALANAPATPATGAGIIIYTIRNERPFILLGKRAGNDPTRHNRTWSNLGGMSECHQAPIDRTLLDTALREVREESNALFNFSPSELEASFSFDLIPNPLLNDFRNDAVINKILYRSYLVKSKYVDPQRLLDAQEYAAASNGQEYIDFKWVDLHDIMAALERKDGMIILENETLKLYPPLLHTLLFPAVRDALSTLASGKSPKKGNFQGLFGKRHANISHHNNTLISRLNPKEAMALQVVQHADVQRQLKARSLLSTGSDLLIADNNSFSNANAFANLPYTQTEGYLKSILSNYEDASPELDVVQARAIHFRNVTNFLNSPELNDPLLIEAFSEAKKYHPEEFHAFVTMLVDAMINERENRNKVVFYHATSAEIGLLFDFLSEIRNTLAINGREQIYLRALDSIFSEYPAIKDFIAEFTVDGITNNYIANYQDAGLAVNPFLFSNGVRPTSCSFWYLWKGFSNWPQISTVFKTLKKRLGMRGSYTEFDKIYQKYFFENDRQHSRLLQIFVEPRFVDKISYSSLNRGHLLKIPVAEGRHDYHGTFEVIRLSRSNPGSLMELLPKTRFNGDGSESVVDIKTLQARIFMKPKYFYQPNITNILSYSLSNNDTMIKNARAETRKFAKDELISMLISNFNVDKDIASENNRLGRLYRLVTGNELDDRARTKNLVDLIETGDQEGLRIWLKTHGQFDGSELLPNRHNGYRQPGYSPVEIAVRSRKFELADALLAHQTGNSAQEERYFSTNFFELNFGMLPVAGLYLENFNKIEKLEYLNRQLFLETLENPSPRMALEKFIKNCPDRFSDPLYAEAIEVARISGAAKMRYKFLLSSSNKSSDIFDVILTYTQQLPKSIQKAMSEHPDLTTKKMLLHNYYQTTFTHLKPVLAYGMYPTRAKHHHAELFSAERKMLHEQIISHYLGGEQEKRPHPNNAPKLVHSAGAPGSGKSTIIKRLSELSIFDLNEFVIIDPDEIRTMLPEYHTWQDRLKNDPTIPKSRIVELSHAEALYISAQIFERAQKAGKNIFRDGTMKDLVFFSQFLAQLKQATPAYKVVIIHVDVDEQVAWSRIQIRGKIEGRFVSRQFFEKAAPQIVNKAIEHLKRLSNFYVKIDNNDSPKITQYLINENAENNAALFSLALLSHEQADYQTILSILDSLDEPTRELNIDKLPLSEFPSDTF